VVARRWRRDRRAGAATTRIIAAVKELQQFTGLPCRAVAIDTVNAVTNGMDENSPAAWGPFLANLQRLKVATGAAIIPVHHTGKDEGRGMRGANALLAKADATLLVSGGKLETKKMRDGKSGQKIPFSIVMVNLWHDHKGKPVGAPVAVSSSRGSMGDVEDQDCEGATLAHTASDSMQARGQMILGVFNTEVEAQRADDQSIVDAKARLTLQTARIAALINKVRRKERLKELSRTTVHQEISALVRAGKLRLDGTGRSSTYRLPT
jgi:hypothetical protein